MIKRIKTRGVAATLEPGSPARQRHFTEEESYPCPEMGIIFLVQNGGHRKGSFDHVFLKICVSFYYFHYISSL